MMNTHFNIASSSFVVGTPTALDSGWMAVAMDDIAAQDIEHSAILRVNQGAFESVCLKMFRSKHVAWLPGRREAVFVGDDGQCAVIAADGSDSDEYVTQGARSPRNTGHLRAATRLGDEVIAVGMQRQVYRRTHEGRWVDMMQGIPETDPAGTTGFECVLALSANEIYAAGWRGELWLFEGKSWRRLDSPTNRILTSMCLAPGGDVIAAGRNGLLIAGRGDRWRILNDRACPDDLWSLTSNGDQVFAAALRRLYALAPDGSASLVEPGDPPAGSFGFLASNEGITWSLGEKDFLSFDGQGWRRIA